MIILHSSTHLRVCLGVENSRIRKKLEVILKNQELEVSHSNTYSFCLLLFWKRKEMEEK